MRSEPEEPFTAGRLPRRITDRVEDAVAWVLAIAALLLVMAAGVTGLTVYGEERDRAALESGTRSQVRAVLLEDAQLVIGELGERLPDRVPARWTGRDGIDRTSLVEVARLRPAGTEVDVWLDTSGKVTTRPIEPVHAVFGGVTVVFGMLCAGGTLLLAMWWGVRELTARRNADRWEHEWERVEPDWRRHLL